MNRPILEAMHHSYHEMNHELNESGSLACKLVPDTDEQYRLHLEINGALMSIRASLAVYNHLVMQALGQEVIEKIK